MAGKSDIPKRPKAIPSRADPIGAVLSPNTYFGEGNMVVRRSELRAVLQVAFRSLEDRKWYRRVWRWLKAPWAKPVEPQQQQQKKAAPARAKIDATGRVVEAGVVDQQHVDALAAKAVADGKPAIEITAR